MKTFNSPLTAPTLALLTSAALAIPALAQDKPASAESKTTTAKVELSEAEMMAKMLELAKPNENHQLLAGLVGNWSFVTKMWMAPGAPPSESQGTAVRKPLMDGRYFLAEFSGKMEMPGADGKMHPVEFKGMSVDGYDNVKKKFVSSWIDNMGTSIVLSEGTYDPATKTITYTADMEIVPGMKTKVREVVKIVDHDHHTFEEFETRGDGQEAKMLEINYVRQK
ncbi:MAG: DUF1579 domain-containing protein [Verrucomicrobia bacterium]|nr:DUF1579 domain-containing protein [Verrucomicrobiota bacterium]